MYEKEVAMTLVVGSWPYGVMTGLVPESIQDSGTGSEQIADGL
jgi:hypothetical protein